MIAQPASAAAKAISFFPLTAPMAMPGRIAMGATAWWEPVAAAVLTLAAIVVLVLLAGRIYTNAILHGGPRLSLREAWRSTATPGPSATGTGAPATGTPAHQATSCGPATPGRPSPVTKDPVSQWS